MWSLSNDTFLIQIYYPHFVKTLQKIHFIADTNLTLAWAKKYCGVGIIVFGFGFGFVYAPKYKKKETEV